MGAYLYLNNKTMKFFFFSSGPDRKHRDCSFTRFITAVTLEDPREPGRVAYLHLAIEMTCDNQSVDRIQQAIEEKVGQPIELDGGYRFGS